MKDYVQTHLANTARSASNDCLTSEHAMRLLEG